MGKKTVALVAVFGVASTFTGIVYFLSNYKVTETDQQAQLQQTASSANTIDGCVNLAVTSTIQKDDIFVSLMEELSSAVSPRDRETMLLHAFARLKILPSEKAKALLTEFLDSGKDFNIGVPFRVGSGGNLRSHPTLRVAILDWFGQIAPYAAKDYARKIFDRSGSADEWALALRNYGRLIKPQSDEYYSAQVRRLLQNKSWICAPSEGFAEAHDAIVFNKQIDLIPLLLANSASNPQYQCLGEMLLDTLVQDDRQVSLAYIGDRMHEFDMLPGWRAKVLARADPRDVRQIAVLRSYMRDFKIGTEEKQLFASMFPLFSRCLAVRLITKDQLLSSKDEQEMLEAAHGLVTRWKNDADFAPVFGVLEQIENRCKQRLVRSEPP